MYSSPFPAGNAISVYIEFCAADSEAIRSRFAILDGCLRKLSLSEQDVVFDTLCDICTEHEQIAFTEGVRLGAQLAREPSE